MLNQRTQTLPTIYLPLPYTTFSPSTTLPLLLPSEPSHLDGEGNSELGELEHVGEGELWVVGRVLRRVDLVVGLLEGETKRGGREGESVCELARVSFRFVSFRPDVDSRKEKERTSSKVDSIVNEDW